MGRGRDGEKRRERDYVITSYWLSGGGGGLVTKSCPFLANPWDSCSFVHGVLKARILKWFAIPFFSGPHSVSDLPLEKPIYKSGNNS